MQDKMKDYSNVFELLVESLFFFENQATCKGKEESYARREFCGAKERVNKCTSEIKTMQRV